jgi:hypothetical protein
MLTDDELGTALYQELNEPDHLDLYLVGVSEYRNENEEEFDRLLEALAEETEVTPHRIAAEDYDRDDVEQVDLFEHEYPDDSVLVVPDTYTFGRGDPTAQDRYREFIDLMPETGLEGLLHLNVEDDLEHAPEREQEYPLETFIDDLGRSYRKRDGRVYDGKILEAESLETALLSKLY